MSNIDSENTAIIYARVSTVRQADDELPIASQLEQCHRKAEDLGLKVLQVYLDEGKSGRYDTRPAFQEAVAYCELMSPGHFITWSSSRFARNIDDSVIYKRRLKRAGVELTFVTMDVDTDTIGGFALDHVMALFDDIYSRQVSEDTKRSMMKNARDGYYNGGNVPLGYAPAPAEDDPKRKRLYVVPDESALVSEIFNLKLQGFGTRSIAIKMNDSNKLNRNRRWNKTSVSSLLRNHSVIGKIAFNKKCKKTGRINSRDKWIVVDAHDPIIKKEVWDLVQESMNEETMVEGIGSPKSQWLFTGLLKCGVCGSSMQIETAKSGKYNYYNCRSHQRSGDCRSHRIPAGDFDQWLVDRISAEVFSIENLKGIVQQLNEACSEWSTNRRKKRASLLNLLQLTENKNSKIFEIMETLGRDTPNLGDMTTRLRKNKTEITRLENELIALDAQHPPKTTVTENDVRKLSEIMVDIIKTSTDPKKIRQFFGEFIKEISVDDVEVRLNYIPEMIVRKRKVLSAVEWLPTPAVLRTKLIHFDLPSRFCRKVA